MHARLVRLLHSALRQKCGWCSRCCIDFATTSPTPTSHGRRERQDASLQDCNPSQHAPSAIMYAQHRPELWRTMPPLTCLQLPMDSPATSATFGAAHGIRQNTAVKRHSQRRETSVNMAALTAGTVLQHKLIATRPLHLRACCRPGARVSMRSGGGGSGSGSGSAEHSTSKEGQGDVQNQAMSASLGDTESVSTQGGTSSVPDAEVVCCAARRRSLSTSSKLPP